MCFSDGEAHYLYYYTRRFATSRCGAAPQLESWDVEQAERGPCVRGVGGAISGAQHIAVGKVECTLKETA